MRIAAVVLLLLATSSAAAREAPPPAPAPARLEVGIGALGMVLPDYRGSDYYSTRFLPVPYVAYRSERLQLTREGLRARLFASERLSITFSGAGSLPGTEDNPDRAGMPRIDPTFELGPSLDVALVGHEPGHGARLKLRVPVRAVFAADGLDIGHIGWSLVPHLRADALQVRGDYSIAHLASLGFAWSTGEYHDYFYGVAPQYADAALGRPAYDAGPGYGGLRASYSGTVRFGKWRLGGFVSYDWLDGAAFDDSPLKKVDHSATAGFFLTYRLYASGTGEPLEGDE